MLITDNEILWAGKKSLTWKIIVSFLLLSSLFTLVATGFRLYQDYKQEIELIHTRMKTIQQSYLKSLSSSLWEVNEGQINLQLKGILSLSDIQFVALDDTTKQLSYSMGSKSDKNIISQKFSLEHPVSQSETVVLGHLTVVATLENVHKRLLNKVFLILTTQALKTFLATFCFLGIVYFLLTRHLKTITVYLQSMTEMSSIEPLALNRKTAPNSRQGIDMEDELDQVVLAINTMQTTINQKVAELRVNEEQYRAVVENIGDFITRYDRSGRHIYANSSTLEATGLQADQYIGKTHKELGYPAYLSELLQENIESVFTTGTQKRIEFDIELASGPMTLELQLNPEFSIDATVQSVVGISRDVTNRKNIEKQLRDSILKLNEAVRAGRVGLWSWDLMTQEVSLSTEWKRQIGYEDHEIKDAYFEWENRVHPGDIDSAKASIESSIREKNQNHRGEFRFRHKDGSYRWILAQASFIFDKGGQAIKMLGSHIDITEQKKLEAELYQSQKMESIGTLAGGIAHDFNNILSSVIGFTELALDSVDKGTDVEGDLQEVYTAGLRAKDLVQQILSFARQSEEKLKPIQIGPIIREVLKFIRSSIPTTIDIKHDLESESVIMASSTQIHRMMMNLCANASQAMEDAGGTLTVTLKDITFSRPTSIGTSTVKPGNYVEIKVYDTGNGVAPQVIDKIFEPYFTTKGPGEGTGMGLAMVHGIVKTYGGYIIVESTSGQGTVFILYLPTARTSKPYTHSKAEELQTGQERILLVDDELQIAELESRILDHLGYSVTTKTSSVDAFEYFKSKPNDFDLVISDVTMPELPGDELAIKLMQVRPDIPVILCTGYSKNISEDKAAEIGVKGLAYKPVVKEDLAIKVRKVLDDARKEPWRD